MTFTVLMVWVVHLNKNNLVSPNICFMFFDILYWWYPSFVWSTDHKFCKPKVVTANDWLIEVSWKDKQNIPVDL